MAGGLSGAAASVSCTRRCGRGRGKVRHVRPASYSDRPQRAPAQPSSRARATTRARCLGGHRGACCGHRMGSGPRTTSRSRARTRSCWSGVVHTKELLTRDHCGGLRYGVTLPWRCVRAVSLLSGRPEDAHSRSARRPWCAVLMQGVRGRAITRSCGDIENGELLPLRCSSFAATRAAPAARRARFLGWPSGAGAWGGPLVRDHDTRAR